MLHAKLRVKIKQELEYSRELAKMIGISRSALGNKLSGKASFKVDEIIRICKILHIKREDVHKYFCEEALWNGITVATPQEPVEEEAEPDGNVKQTE